MKYVISKDGEYQEEKPKKPAKIFMKGGKVKYAGNRTDEEETKTSHSEN